MGLSGKPNGNGGSPNKELFVTKDKVANVECQYNAVAPWDENKVDDIALTITFDIGRDFKPKLTIRGNYNRDDVTRHVTGWGSAFKIRAFLNACGQTDFETDEYGNIPPDVFRSCIGAEVCVLKYITQDKEGKTVFNSYDLIGTDEAKLEKEFRTQHAKTGFPRNWMPELVQSNAAPNPVGNPAVGVDVQNLPPANGTIKVF